MKRAASVASRRARSEEGESRAKGFATSLLLHVILALAGVGAIPPLSIAEEKAAPAAEAKPTPEIETIPIAEIGVTSEREKRVLKEMSEGLGPTETYTRVKEQLPEMTERVESGVSFSKASREGDPSLQVLDQLKNGWSEVSNELTGMQSALSARSGEIAAQLKKTEGQDQIWKATREKAVEMGVDERVVAQIDEVEVAIREAVKRARDRQAAILALQSEVAALSEDVADDLKAIEGIRLSLVGKVLQRDKPPMWRAAFWESIDRDAIEAKLAARNSQQLEAITQYVARRHDALVLHGVLTLLFVALLYRLRPIAKRMLVDEPQVEHVRVILEIPLALTTLISLLLAYFWISSESLVLEPLIIVAMVFPAVVVLRRVVDPAVFPLLNALVAIVLFGRVRSILAPLVVLSRLLFVLEIVGILLLLAFWMRSSRLKAIPREVAQGFPFRALGTGLKLLVVVGLASLLAEIAGYGALSHLLEQSMSAAGGSAVVLYGAYRVSQGLVAVILRARPLSRLGMVQRHRSLIQQRVLTLIRWGAVVSWALVTASAAQVLTAILSTVGTALSNPLPFAEIAITPGDVLAAALALWASILLSRFIRFALEEDIYTRMHLVKGRPYAISTLIHYTILIIGFVLAANALGFQSDRFTLVAGAFGVGIGFGLQSIVNNFVSGIILLTERPVEVGDIISMGEIFGRVERIGIRSSTVRSLQGAEVIVPNADLVAQPVTNWTLSDRRRRLEIVVGVAYGSDPSLVMEVLLGATKSVDQVMTDPEPYVLFNGFGESSLDFEIRGWTDDFDAYLEIRSNVCVAIASALAEAGLEIPFPQRDLHIRSVVGDDVEPNSPSGEVSREEPVEGASHAVTSREEGAE